MAASAPKDSNVGGNYFDVVIVGAGLSGVGAGVHLTQNCPNKSFIVFESRDAVGGTWDLFRYPGIRSDSDMFTLGYCFKPWLDAKSIADGPSILKYINETAQQYGVDSKIRLKHRVVNASWSSELCQWDVEVEKDGKDRIHFSCSFLLTCTGYYDYESGYSPEFPGRDSFRGTVFHPQIWPQNFDYTGKRVVIIGSGATAITLLPSMAQSAAHVTMLQRSPTYIFARPSEVGFTLFLRRVLPSSIAYILIRWIFILQSILLFQVARRSPEKTKKVIISEAKKNLPPGFDVHKHFSPTYNPWCQRVCLAPDADFFKAICSGKASVVTDKIEKFTPSGIKLVSGEEIQADVIITATGLNVKILTYMDLFVDGKKVDKSSIWFYKGIMYSDVPNMASAFGYTNASWTLKADLNCKYVCRLLNFMDSNGFKKCVPVRTEQDGKEGLPWADFSSGYIQRSLHEMPKQGPRFPWKLYQNYAIDFCVMRFGDLVDGVMQFSGPNGRKSGPPPLFPSWIVTIAASLVVSAALYSFLF